MENWSEPGEDRAQIRLDVLALVELTHMVSRARARGRGHPLDVASIDSYLPCASYAVCAARGPL